MQGDGADEAPPLWRSDQSCASTPGSAGVVGAEDRGEESARGRTQALAAFSRCGGWHHGVSWAAPTSRALSCPGTEFQADRLADGVRDDRCPQRGPVCDPLLVVAREIVAAVPARGDVTME